jgi:hypothetical protein
MVGDVNAVERRNTFTSTISSSAVTQAMTQRQTSSLLAIVVTSWPITIRRLKHRSDVEFLEVMSVSIMPYRKEDSCELGSTLQTTSS